MSYQVEPQKLPIPTHIRDQVQQLCCRVGATVELWIYDGLWTSRGFHVSRASRPGDSSSELHLLARRCDDAVPQSDAPSLLTATTQNSTPGASTGQRPQTVRFSDGSDALTWCLDRSWPQWWATWPNAVDFDTTEQTLAQTAELLEYERELEETRRRLGELEEENSALIQQISSDFDEISLLRALSEHLDVSDLIHDFVSLAETLFPDVRRAVQAEVVALVPAQFVEDELAVQEPAVWIGPELMTPTECAELIRSRLRSFRRREQRERKSYLCREVPELAQVRSMVMAPLFRGSEFFGTILAINQVEEGRCRVRVDKDWDNSLEFGPQECTLLATIASIMSVHAANVGLFQEKEQLMTDMIRALVTAIDAKDEYTRGHSERVALYSQRLGQEAGLSLIECEQLYLTGLLHDIGKIGISDAVLKKPSCLTDEEFAEIMRHPDEGWAILCDLEQLRYTLPGVLHHHERWDGCGYPDGLKGTEIPRPGRILAIVDGFDAMTSDRPYRQGMPIEKAAQILKNGAGTQWDPELVELFLKILPEIELIRSFYKSPRKRIRQRTNSTS